MPDVQRTAVTSAPVLSLNDSRRRLCPVCGGSRADVLHTQRLVLPEEFGLPEIFDVVKCRACGMVYSNTTAEADRLTIHYRDDAYCMHNWEDREPVVREDALLGSPVDVDRLRVVAQELSRLPGSPDLRVLDVGCASGTLLALLREAGFSDVQGIDPSPGAVTSANRLGVRARVADLDAPLPAEFGTFDVIILSHVLEHLGAPRDALANVWNALRPNGLVYAEVPDAARYAELLAEPFVDFNHEHVNHFSLPHLNELFQLSGFAPVTSGQKLITVVNCPYPAVYGIWRKVEVIPKGPWCSTLDVDCLRDSLLPYIAGSHDLLARYSSEIETRLAGRRQVAVRCLGYRAWTLLANTILDKLDVVAYIDNAPEKQGLTVRGLRVCGPEAPLPPDIPIVVLAFYAADAIGREYASSDPRRDVIAVGRSQPAFRIPDAVLQDAASTVHDEILTGHVR